MIKTFKEIESEKYDYIVVKKHNCLVFDEAKRDAYNNIKWMKIDNINLILDLFDKEWHNGNPLSPNQLRRLFFDKKYLNKLKRKNINKE